LHGRGLQASILHNLGKVYVIAVMKNIRTFEVLLVEEVRKNGIFKIVVTWLHLTFRACDENEE
jgi:hypothetical protein